MSATPRHWLRVFLNTHASPASAPNGYGAHVVANTPDGREQHRWINGASSYLSQSELSAHFGLSASTRTSLTVHWPDGSSTTRWGVAADRTMTISPCTADWNADGVVSSLDIFDFLSDWFQDMPRGTFNPAGGAAVSDIITFLNAWFAGCR